VFEEGFWSSHYKTTCFLLDSSVLSAIKLTGVKRCFAGYTWGTWTCKTVSVHVDGSKQIQMLYWSSVIFKHKPTFVQKPFNSCVSVTLYLAVGTALC